MVRRPERRFSCRLANSASPPLTVASFFVGNRLWVKSYLGPGSTEVLRNRPITAKCIRVIKMSEARQATGASLAVASAAGTEPRAAV